MADLAKAFHRPYVHDGGYSSFRRRRFGAPAEDVPPEHFVVFAQNHDQVGNRAFGDRLPRAAQPLAAFCFLLSAFTPMLFMGEEYGERAPFQFFSDHIDKKIADGDPRGAAARVRGVRRVRRGGPGPAGRRPPSSARSSPASATRELARLYAAPAGARGADAPGDADAIAFDDDARWLTVRRGPFQLVVQLRAIGPPAYRVRMVRCCSATHGRAASDRRTVELDALAGALIAMTEVWPGRPFPLGADVGRAGHQLLALLRARREGRAVPLRRRRTARRASS